MCTHDGVNGKFWKVTLRSVHWTSAVCFEMSAPSIANTEMLWESSLGWKWASLKHGSCRGKYYIKWGLYKTILSRCSPWLRWVSFPTAIVGFKCYIIIEASFSWLVIFGALFVVKMSFTAGLFYYSTYVITGGVYRARLRLLRCRTPAVQACGRLHSSHAWRTVFRFILFHY